MKHPSPQLSWASRSSEITTVCPPVHLPVHAQSLAQVISLAERSFSWCKITQNPRQTLCHWLLKQLLNWGRKALPFPPSQAQVLSPEIDPCLLSARQTCTPDPERLPVFTPRPGSLTCWQGPACQGGTAPPSSERQAAMSSGSEGPGVALRGCRGSSVQVSSTPELSSHHLLNCWSWCGMECFVFLIGSLPN